MIKGMFVGLDGSPVAESVMESGEPTGGRSHHADVLQALSTLWRMTT